MTTIFCFLFFSVSHRIFKCKSVLVKNISLAKLLLYRRRDTLVDSVLNYYHYYYFLYFFFIRLRSHGRGQVFVFVHTEPFNKNFD